MFPIRPRSVLPAFRISPGATRPRRPNHRYFRLWLERLEDRTQPSTVQDFDVANTGSPYDLGQHAGLPTAALLPGGPSGVGRFLRLAHQITTGVPNQNSISFGQTDTPSLPVVVADFAFRMQPLPPGRGDGFGFALLNTSLYPATGVVAPQAPLFSGEEPNFTGSFGLGFDIYKNTEPNTNDIDQNTLGTHNVITVHFSGAIVAQFDGFPAFDLASGEWVYARAILQQPVAGQPMRLTLTLRPRAGGTSATVADNLPIPGLMPYSMRAHFASRSGGASSHVDIDDVAVHYVNSSPAIFTLSAAAYTAIEGGSPAVVMVTRSGNTTTGANVGLTIDNQAPMTLSFAAGEVSKPVSIPTGPDDQTSGPARTIRLGLSAPSAGAVIGGPSKATVTVADDETARLSGLWGLPVGIAAVPVDASLLPDGRVLYWDRLGNVRALDPTTLTVTTPADPGVNLFCAGHAYMADGTLLVAGGHHHGGSPMDDGVGTDTASRYNPATGVWEALPLMNAGRWYPTVTALSNGEVLVISGSVDEQLKKNPLPQVWQPASRTWRNLTGAAIQAPLDLADLAHGGELYPWMFQAPDGRVYKAGPDATTWYLDARGAGSWVQGPNHVFGHRGYGSAVMYEPGKILVTGGGIAGDPDNANDATNTAEVIDLNAPNPVWRAVGALQFARRQHQLVLLPGGKVLALGGVGIGTPGSNGFNNEANPVLSAELWDPQTERWTTLSSSQETRGYHSLALLLPDGRVMLGGGGQGSGAVSSHADAEFFSPPDLFRGPRPVIASVPASVSHGQSFFVSTPDGGPGTRASLIRLPSVTHSFDQNQRHLSLVVSPAAGGLTIAVPNAFAAPPGDYLFFLVTAAGVPSVGRVIRVAPLGIAAVTIGDGVSQPSVVRSLTVTFTGVATINPGAFDLVKLGTGGGTVLLNVSTQVAGGRTVATLTFQNFTDLNSNGSLADGNYRLTVRSSAVTDSSGLPLDGDGDGVPGGDHTVAFFRLFGDADGDRDVDFSDLARFRLALGSATNYNPAFDFDGDGDVDFSDLARFRLRLGTVLP